MTDWPVKTLGEVALVGAGNSAPQDKELFKGGMHRFVRTSDVGQVRIGRLGKSADLLNDAGAEGLREFRAGVTLMPKSGASTFLNHRVQLTKPCFVSSHLAVVDPNPKVMDDTFIFYFLQTVRSQDLIQDQSYPSLNLPAISGINVLVPPLDEQKRIVALLDAATSRVTELTACYEQARTHANNLFSSALREALESNSDWPIKTIGEICLGIDRQDPAVSGQTEFTYIDLSAVNQMTKQIDDARTLPVNEAPGRARQLVKSGDVLVSTVRPNLNAVALVGSVLNGSTASTGFCVLRPNRTIVEPGVLFAWTRNQRFIDELTSQAKGASYPAVTDNVVKALEIPVPPLEEQKQIVRRLDLMREKTSEMVVAYDAKLTAAKNLRQSILEAAFAGDL